MNIMMRLLHKINKNKKSPQSPVLVLVLLVVSHTPKSCVGKRLEKNNVSTWILGIVVIEWCMFALFLKRLLNVPEMFKVYRSVFSTTSSVAAKTSAKKKVVILGCGWAGMYEFSNLMHILTWVQ
jgi:hypothetical protein